MKRLILLVSQLALLIHTDIVWSKPVEELVFYNWAEYVAPEVVQAFETKHNAKIKMKYFESDAERDAFMASTAGKGVDMLVVTGINIESYVRRGWLYSITPADLSNLQWIEPRSAQACNSQYAVPYFWGTLGIGYRSDLVDSDFVSWMDFFKPPAKLHQQLMAMNDPKDLIGAALKALGYSFNSVDKGQLREAEELLVKFNPDVKYYGYALNEKGSGLVTGEIAAAMLYNGDVLLLNAQYPDVPLKFSIPKEGSVAWTDCIAITASSAHKTLALEFIDYINQPENAAAQALYVNYASPNNAAEKLLPAEFLSNPIIYPSKATLDKLEPYQVHSPRDIKKRNELFSRITQ